MLNLSTSRFKLFADENEDKIGQLDCPQHFEMLFRIQNSFLRFHLYCCGYIHRILQCKLESEEILILSNADDVKNPVCFGSIGFIKNFSNGFAVMLVS